MMPSTMTHSYFACDIYERLCNKHYISSLDNFKLYSQGSDPFMFYNYLIGKKNKYFCNIQKMIHTTDTRNYFINIIEYIINNDMTSNKDLITFLYGNICHYFLDAWCHPFIYYKTGIFKKGDKSTYKYNALHQDMEFSIDRYLIMKRSQTKVNKFKIYKEIFDDYKISNEVINCFNYIIKETYGIDNIANSYDKSVKMMRRFFYLFNYDRFGIKRNVYKFVDWITPSNIIKIKELSYATEDINIDYLNLDNKKWNHPSIKDEIYNYSFFDLYNFAMNDVMSAIKVVDECIINKDLNIKKLRRVFKNLSCSTGKDCQLNLEFKYFEF